jgi:hypothetical protein
VRAICTRLRISSPSTWQNGAGETSTPQEEKCGQRWGLTYLSLTLTVTPAVASTAAPAGEAARGGPMQQAQRLLQLETRQTDAYGTTRDEACERVCIYRETG